jgi:3-carboxy-cis,cis-muconate cycloisomerase
MMAEPFDWGLLEPLASGSEASSLTGDDAVLTALVEVESALSAAWADAGFAPAWAGEVAAMLTDAPLDRDAIGRGSRAGGNPVIPLVTALRLHADRLHDGAGDWVHRGATSQDILDSALMLVASRAVAAAVVGLDALAVRLATLAAAHRGTLMAGRTLTQHAAPITFGAKVCGWLDGVEAALAGLERLTFPVQLAGSVGIGSAFLDLTGEPEAPAQLRAALATRLGLADPHRSWQVERSPVAVLGAALAVAIGVLGRISADILVLARTEVSEVAEGDGGSSSAMPQKRNPATAVLVTAAAQQSPALLATLVAALVSADERPAATWHAEWQAARRLLALAVETAEASVALIDGLRIDAERMRVNLDLTAGLIHSEQVLSQLTRDLGRAEASRIVGAAVGNSVPDGSAPDGAVSFAEGVPIELSTGPIIRAAGMTVDAALARHAARLQSKESR